MSDIQKEAMPEMSQKPRKDFREKPPKTNPTIDILGLDGDKLDLSDGGVTVTKGNNLITWKVAIGVDITITKIEPKTADDDVFSQKPHAIDSTRWEARTKNPGTNKIIGYYSISYIILNDPNTYKDDPIIQVNP